MKNGCQINHASFSVKGKTCFRKLFNSRLTNYVVGVVVTPIRTGQAGRLRRRSRSARAPSVGNLPTGWPRSDRLAEVIWSEINFPVGYWKRPATDRAIMLTDYWLYGVIDCRRCCRGCMQSARPLIVSWRKLSTMLFHAALITLCVHLALGPYKANPHFQSAVSSLCL